MLAGKGIRGDRFFEYKLAYKGQINFSKARFIVICVTSLLFGTEVPTS